VSPSSREGSGEPSTPRLERLSTSSSRETPGTRRTPTTPSSIPTASPTAVPRPTANPTVSPTPIVSPTCDPSIPPYCEPIITRRLRGAIDAAAGAPFYVVLEGNPWDPKNSYDTKLYPNNLNNPTVIERRSDAAPGISQVISTSDGHTFSFVETMGGVQTAAGIGAFLDLNGDGAYDTLRVTGTNKGVVVQADLGLVFVDTTGNGKADWVSVPWALAGILGVPAGDPQIWLPLTADSAGRPTTVNVKMPDPASPGQYGGIDFVLPIVPASQGGPDHSAVPALSGLGLLALAISLGAAGFFLVRGRILG